MLPSENTEEYWLKICLTGFCHRFYSKSPYRESPGFNSSASQVGEWNSGFIFLTISEINKRNNSYPNVPKQMNSLHCISIKAKVGNIFSHDTLSWNTVGKCLLKVHTVNNKWNRVSETMASLFMTNNWSIFCLDYPISVMTLGQKPKNLCASNYSWAINVDLSWSCHQKVEVKIAKRYWKSQWIYSPSSHARFLCQDVHRMPLMERQGEGSQQLGKQGHSWKKARRQVKITVLTSGRVNKWRCSQTAVCGAVNR